MIKVATINTFANQGGAANAAYRTHIALRRHEGIKPFYLVREKGSCKDNMTFSVKTKRGKWTAAINRLFQKFFIVNNRTPISTTMFSTHFTDNDITRSRQIKEVDIINLHWVEDFISLKNLRQIVETKKPILWTLHDERAYTGGCHYTADCKGFIDDCGKCEQLKFDPFKIAKGVLETKYQILKDANFTVVATSQWQYNEVKKSKLFRDCRVELITNSLDTKQYAPQDKKQAKEKNGINGDVLTLQFGAHNINDIRKGYIYLKDALTLCMKNEKFKQLCDEGKIVVLKLGKTNALDSALPINTKEFGLIKDNNKLIELYNATDIFILPSLEDNLPYSMVETMSCGTPVIAFDTGGISDIIDSECGVLVPKRDTEKLAKAILELVFDNDKRELFSKNSRKKIEDNCTYEIQGKKYYELYKNLLKDKK